MLRKALMLVAVLGAAVVLSGCAGLNRRAEEQARNIYAATANTLFGDKHRACVAFRRAYASPELRRLERRGGYRLGPRRRDCLRLVRQYRDALVLAGPRLTFRVQRSRITGNKAILIGVAVQRHGTPRKVKATLRRQAGRWVLVRLLRF